MPPKRKVAKISSSDIEDAIPEIITSDKMKFMRQLNIMKKWKEGKVADVDVYGCDTLAEAGVEPKVNDGWLVTVAVITLVGTEVSGAGGLVIVFTDKGSDYSGSRAQITVNSRPDTS